MSAISPMRVVGIIGRVLLTTGVLMLAFVAYQLWGTGLHEAEAQRELNDEFDQLLAAHPPPTTEPGSPATLPAEAAPSQQLAVNVGDPIGRLSIPKLHLEKVVVEGIPLVELDRAPGHYPQTPFPGQAGNSAIAGHRSTYGAPFYNIDKLRPGDKIHITTLQGEFTYEMQWSKIVKPDEVWVLDQDPDHPNTLTLTACHPRMSLAERYIVRAELVGEPAPELPGQDAVAAPTSDELADGRTRPSNPDAWPHLVGWAAVCAAIWIGAWWVSRRWRNGAHRQPPRWVRALVPYVLAIPVFSVTLFFAFENLSNVLPAGL